MKAMGVGNLRIAEAQRKQREAMDRLVAELRAREEAGFDDDAESEAAPYRRAEEIARELHARR